MVPILIATAVREAVLGAGRPGPQRDALLEIVRMRHPKLAAPAAPYAGLCFIGAEYENELQNDDDQM
jgi:hypothetical protein